MKRVLVSGYYGFSNTGDEAVLSAIIAGLKSHVGEDIEITVLSAAPEETAKLHGVRAVPRITGAVKAIRECDLFISGGGSLIQDATSLRSLVYYLSLISLAKFYRRRVMVLGQGIGPLRRGISRWLTRRVLNGVNLITVRDAQSAELLREIGVSRPPVHVTADPTFLLEPCPSEESAGLLSEAGIGEGDDVIAVSLRNWPEASGIERAASEALAIIADKLPAKLLLVTMHSPEDEILAGRVKQVVPMAAVQPKPWTASQLLGVFERCRLVVGMRLHSLIFASAVGTPFVGIEYDPKVKSFLAAAGQESVTLGEAASGMLADKILSAWNNRDASASQLAERVPAMRESAAENYRLAAELIGADDVGQSRDWMKRMLPWITGAVILGALIWSFFYLKDAHPLGSLGSKLGRDSLEGISIRFKNAELIGRSNGKKIWMFQARTIDVSSNRQWATFRGVSKGTLLQDGREIASLSSKKVVYNTYTNNVSAPNGAEVVLKEGPSFNVHDVYWNGKESKLLCQKGVDVELAGSTLHGEKMTADLNKKELVIEKVKGQIKIGE